MDSAVRAMSLCLPGCSLHPMGMLDVATPEYEPDNQDFAVIEPRSIIVLGCFHQFDAASNFASKAAVITRKDICVVRMREWFGDLMAVDGLIEHT